jgi:hypothetical protein
MLSKLISKHVIHQGVRLTTRSASAVAQQKSHVNRQPEVKHQKVCLSIEKMIPIDKRMISIGTYFSLSSYLSTMNLSMH